MAHELQYKTLIGNRRNLEVSEDFLCDQTGAANMGGAPGRELNVLQESSPLPTFLAELDGV